MPALDLYTAFSGQWRAGPGGVYALDYGVIQHELERRRLPDAEHDDLWWALRIMESAALDILQSK